MAIQPMSRSRVAGATSRLRVKAPITVPAGMAAISRPISNVLPCSA